MVEYHDNNLRCILATYLSLSYARQHIVHSFGDINELSSLQNDVEEVLPPDNRLAEGAPTETTEPGSKEEEHQQDRCAEGAMGRTYSTFSTAPRHCRRRRRRHRRPVVVWIAQGSSFGVFGSNLASTRVC